MVAGSATAIGASDLITSSTKQRKEIILKKQHKCGHLYTENINRNDIDIIKHVAGCLP